MVQTKIMSELNNLLREKEYKYFVDGDLNKARVIEDLHNYEPELIKLLNESEVVKKHFLIEINGTKILKINELIEIFEMNEYWDDSYTAYENKIGLTFNDKFLSNTTEVVLDFPYKDTVLKASMSKDEKEKEDLLPDEPFLNNKIAREEIDTLFDNKVLVNVTRYNKPNTHEVNQFSKDDNLIIKGNNLIALHSLKEMYAGKVKLIYIDPPFNTGGDSFLYNDNFNHSSWLTFMKNRLAVARELLADDGNIVIHLDWNESHYLKVLADEIFGRENFLNEIIWHYEKWTATSNNLQKNHDTLLVYSKNKGNHHFNQIKRMTENLKEKYEKGYLIGGGGGSTGLVVYDRNKPKVKEMIASGKYDVVYSEPEGKPLSDVWAIPFINPVSHERTGFNSQKPEILLQRILEVFSNEGDIVLDFFMGSGTTPTVAHKLNRRYISIEQIDSQIEIALDRLVKTINGDSVGISKSVNWQGGGSFVYAELMEKNTGYLKDVIEAESTDRLREIFNLMIKYADFDFRVDLEEVKDSVWRLPLENQKRILIKIIDKNQLYYNYSEIDDENVRDLISDSDYAFNKSFYENEGGDNE